ncbi:NirD/YgiW/YdeI family stress tolerance protein [Alginatibacterium sediminis]|uniref:NirD/YgiW/YdeI family stress tolerance protein n=1 Tax=Alginatibacterium sediminis TaxID=2164068 RepID=A0A420EDF3_9ALTE|nr:NirD/YgiW/YdeI family stress tolerance protein [Alginatibacterium sediminis]RKF18700.1 NirD/YgiW/YdeI family stress tolerance protein [Alginatibacterium sediminis]
MKNKLIVSSILVLTTLTSAGAFAAAGFSSGQTAQSTQSSSVGFNGNLATPDTVKAASQARDDSYVTLTGNIIDQVGHELYTFSDGTGQIVVEIENEDWYGINVTPETKLTIQGEVDQGWTTVKVDVDRIHVVN